MVNDKLLIGRLKIFSIDWQKQFTDEVKIGQQSWLDEGVLQISELVLDDRIIWFWYD